MSEEDLDDVDYNPSGSFDSPYRSTNQLIDKAFYFDQLTTHLSNEGFDDSWRNNDPLCDAKINGGNIQNDFETECTDLRKLKNVSKHRKNLDSSFQFRQKQQKAFQETSYYREPDDALYYDVTSNASFVRWPEKLQKIPVQGQFDLRNVTTDISKKKWGNPPMPVTFYKKNKEPFTVI